MRHASRTAVIFAFFRALESNRPPGDRLFYDPYAKIFLTPILKMWVWLSASRFFRWVLPLYIELRWPGSITSVVARTRRIDDLTRQAIAEQGVYQVVILGAGYETRAYRLANENRQFVEVDRPLTQRHKQNLLDKLAERPPTPVDYVAMDFHTETPEAAIPRLLQRSRYKTLIIWEGAVNNLTASLGNTLFRYFQEYPPGTLVIFNYVNRRMLDNPRAFYGAVRVMRMLKTMGEQWDTGLYPEELSGFLARYNMELILDEEAAEYRQVYSGARNSRKMKGYDFLRLAMARVR